MRTLYLVMLAFAFPAMLAISLFAGDQEAIADLIERAAKAASEGKHDESIAIATQAITRDPTAAEAYYLRGRERFRTGKIKDSVVDFDRYVELRPDAAPRQWERGIACYYAGMYEKGARQFESYQQFDGEDVENSVWRFLCLVPQVGVAKAQSTMLPIKNDPRIPMMKIYDLYRGKSTPEEVIAQAKADAPSDEILNARLFYANLYLGLWYEANQDGPLARKHIELAADERLQQNRRINSYMWDVARIHLKLIRGELEARQQ